MTGPVRRWVAEALYSETLCARFLSSPVWTTLMVLELRLNALLSLQASSQVKVCFPAKVLTGFPVNAAITSTVRPYMSECLVRALFWISVSNEPVVVPAIRWHPSDVGQMPVFKCQCLPAILTPSGNKKSGQNTRGLQQRLRTQEPPARTILRLQNALSRLLPQNPIGAVSFFSGSGDTQPW